MLKCRLRLLDNFFLDQGIVRNVEVTKTGNPVEVLLIEDNIEDQFLTKRMLENTKYARFNVCLAENLLIGIRRAKEQDIDIILLDLNLPDSSGIKTFTKLNSQFPEIPVVVLSGFEDEEESISHYIWTLGKRRERKILLPILASKAAQISTHP